MTIKARIKLLWSASIMLSEVSHQFASFISSSSDSEEARPRSAMPALKLAYCLTTYYTTVQTDRSRFPFNNNAALRLEPHQLLLEYSTRTLMSNKKASCRSYVTEIILCGKLVAVTAISQIKSLTTYPNKELTDFDKLISKSNKTSVISSDLM